MPKGDAGCTGEWRSPRFSAATEGKVAQLGDNTGLGARQVVRREGCKPVASTRRRETPTDPTEPLALASRSQGRPQGAFEARGRPQKLARLRVGRRGPGWASCASLPHSMVTGRLCALAPPSRGGVAPCPQVQAPGHERKGCGWQVCSPEYSENASETWSMVLGAAASPVRQVVAGPWQLCCKSLQVAALPTYPTPPRRAEAAVQSWRQQAAPAAKPPPLPRRRQRGKGCVACAWGDLVSTVGRCACGGWNNATWLPSDVQGNM